MHLHLQPPDPPRVMCPLCLREVSTYTTPEAPVKIRYCQHYMHPAAPIRHRERCRMGGVGVREE